MTSFVNSPLTISDCSRTQRLISPTHSHSSWKTPAVIARRPRHVTPSPRMQASPAPHIQSEERPKSNDGLNQKRKVISSLEKVSYDVSGVRVVEDVSLYVYDGEIVCILGPSGSGKSTLLRMLAGLTKPSSGRALYRGRPFKGVNPATSIVFQTFALYPWLTVLENVELGLSNMKNNSKQNSRMAISAVDKEMLRARAMRTIDTIGLDGYENAYPRELSGGMRQRVGFARALAVEPELLCMDEPFSALDVLTAQNLRTELLRLWQAGDVPTTAVLIVTHSIEEAVTLADRIVILGKDPGYIRTILPVNLSHPRNRKASNFQAVTDLVYTILSERDYTVSSEDLAILNGISPTPSISPLPVNTSTDTTRVSQSQSQQYVQFQSSQETAFSTRVQQRNLVSSASAIKTPPRPPKNSQAVNQTDIYLDGLSLSEPLRPVTLDLEFDGNGNQTPVSSTLESRYPQLPAVRIGSVSGFLSFIAEESVDLYVLGQRLQLDVDDLYPLIDAANILGLIEVDEGDIRRNSKGLRFEHASIDERKNMVREACLTSRGARLIAQIYRLLSEAQYQKLPQELIFDTILLKHFSPIESRKQLEIAIEWGRFAELFGYESLTGTLFFDTGDIPDVV